MAWLGPQSSIARANAIEVSLEILPGWKTLFSSTAGVALGSQAFDPRTGNFLFEGDWQAIAEGQNKLAIAVPAEDGRYQFWISLVSPDKVGPTNAMPLFCW